MIDKLVIKCNSHSKSCTDYCKFDNCSEPNRFFCPRCIKMKLVHKNHENSISDISNFKQISHLILDIIGNDSDYSESIQPLNQLIAFNESIIAAFVNINEEIKKQLQQKSSNEGELISFITNNYTLSGDKSYKSELLTNLIREIKERKLLEYPLYEQIKSKFEYVYQSLGKSISRFSDSMQDDLEAVIQKKEQEIQKQIQNISQSHTQFFKNQKEMLQQEFEDNIKEVQSQSSQIDDSTISKDQSIDMNDLFSSQINPNQPKKYILHNPGLTKLTKSNSSAQSNGEQIKLSYKSDTDCFEERKQSHQKQKISSYSKSDGEYEIKSNPKKKLLLSFKPELKRTVQMGDVTIFSINLKAKVILLSQNILPQVLQFYSINELTINPDSNINLSEDSIVDAMMSEDTKRIVVATQKQCRVQQLDNGKYYDLKTKLQKDIAKVEINKNGMIIIQYSDLSFDIYQNENMEHHPRLYTDPSQQVNNSAYYLNLVEEQVALQLINNKCLYLFNTKSRETLWDQQEKYQLNSIEMNNDKNLIATSGLSTNVTIYSYNKKKQEFDILTQIETQHSDEILQTKLINLDQWLITISGDSTWKVFEMKSSNMIYLQSTESQNAYIKCEFFPEDNTLLFIDQYGELKIYQLS